MYGDESLLDINLKNPGDCGQRLLPDQYKVDRLETSMLPLTIDNRYSKPELDAERSELLHSKLDFVNCSYFQSVSS